MIYEKSNVKQLKLVTGDEVICEILEEDEHDIIIRNVLSIHFNALEDGSRMWTFKLFMCYQDDPDRFVLVKVDKIVAIANPIKELLQQYVSAIKNIMVDEDGDIHQMEEEYMMDSDSSNVLKFPTFH